MSKRKRLSPEEIEGRRLRKCVKDFAVEHDCEFLLADGFDEAIIGLIDPYVSGETKVVYDWDKCVEILMRDMSEEDALEHMSFNVTGGYVGEHTPIFIRLI